MMENKLESLASRLNDLLYRMEVELPSWVCSGNIMSELSDVSEELTKIAYEKEGID